MKFPSETIAASCSQEHPIMDQRTRLMMCRNAKGGDKRPGVCVWLTLRRGTHLLVNYERQET